MLNLAILRRRKLVPPTPDPVQVDTNDRNAALEDHELEHVAGGRAVAWHEDMRSIRHDPGIMS